MQLLKRNNNITFILRSLPALIQSDGSDVNLSTIQFILFQCELINFIFAKENLRPNAWNGFDAFATVVLCTQNDDHDINGDYGAGRNLLDIITKDTFTVRQTFCCRRFGAIVTFSVGPVGIYYHICQTGMFNIFEPYLAADSVRKSVVDINKYLEKFLMRIIM